MKQQNTLESGAVLTTARWAFERLMTRKQVAAMIGVCTESVKRYGRMGLLKTIRFNARMVRYDPEDVERFINQARGGEAQ